MENRTPSEQAVIQALQTVTNHPKSGDFVEKMSRILPGLQTLLDVLLQPEGGMLASQGPRPSTEAPSALSPVSMLSPISEEPGRKRTSSHDSQLSWSYERERQPYQSCPPPDKRENDPQLSMREVM